MRSLLPVGRASHCSVTVEQLLRPNPRILACSARVCPPDSSLHPRRSALSTQRRHEGPVRAAAEAPPSADNAKTWSLYDHPELHDVAFGFRDFAAEADFLESIFEQHTGRTAEVFLELGCGAARHSMQLALRGHKAFALDNSSLQLEYAEKKATEAGAAVEFLRDDMRDYELPPTGRIALDTVSWLQSGAQADVAAMLLGTLLHLHTHAEVRACLRCTLASLAPGGVLVIEVPHPEDVFDGAFLAGDAWEAPLGGGAELIIEFGTDDDYFDPETQVLRKRIGVSVRRGEEIDIQGEGLAWQRIFTLQELLLLAEMSGFEVAATHGELSLDVALFDREASRLVLVLQKPAEVDTASTEFELEQ